jgi:uncharacterized spore protein YtfJ
MNVPDILQSIAERLQNSATVESVYGDPVTAEGKMIIPVAKIRYGFGGGGGSGESPMGTLDETEESAEADGAVVASGSGGGGGGDVSVTPVGYIEITDGKSRYVSIEERKMLINTGLITAAVTGFIVWRRLPKRK